MSLCWVFSLATGTAVVMGSLACTNTMSPGESDPRAALCATSNISGPTEPQSPQSSCATGSTTSTYVPQNWAVLSGNLCLTTGIPAAGLSGAQCTDPSTMTVTVTEKGRQLYTTDLVQGSLTDTNPANFFVSCTPASAGTIKVEPANIEGQDSATFTITQETAYFVSGTNAQLPPICSVAITDSHEQQVLVNIGIQIGVVCANSSCTPPASATASSRRRRLR